MTKSTVLLSLLVVALVPALTALPAQAQRVFVSGSGSDSNPCTFAQPCRSFQQAFNTAPANGEIDVLDPAGYGPLTITNGISIQAHGFGGITQTTNGGYSAITIEVTTSDPVTLNGLLLDGAGSGSFGIDIVSGGSVQILNCVVRHFTTGIFQNTSTASANLLIEDTIVSDNPNSGIDIEPSGGAPSATLSRITANNNNIGVYVYYGSVTIRNSAMSNNNTIGLGNVSGTTVWLAKSTISGNGSGGASGAGGVHVFGGTVNSYGDNDINGNSTDVVGSLTPVSTE